MWLNRKIIPKEKTFTRQEIILLIISGFLLGLSFPPSPLYFLSFIGFVPFFIVIEKKESLADISKSMFITGFFFALITLYWVGSWTKEADPFLMISGVALLFFNPITFMIPTTLYYMTKRYVHKNAIILFPIFWVAYEYFYSISDFRFPWLVIGNALSKAVNLIQIADIIGAAGLSLIILYINVLIFKYTLSKKWLYISIPVLLIIIISLYGVFRIKSLEKEEAGLQKIKVGLIQPDFNPWEKWKESSLPEQLDIYIKMSRGAVSRGAKIIFWPESALPGYLLNGAYENEVMKIRQFIAENKVILITGMPHLKIYNKNDAPEDAKVNSSGSLYYTTHNAILGFSPVLSEVQTYSKIKLVPFGEFVPLAERIPFLGELIKWNVGISSWNAGKTQNIFKYNATQIFPDKNFDIKIGVINCIESIYSEFVTEFTNNGAELLAVVTNDSWYGYSSGPFQHKEFAAIRAVENRRFVLQAANGGISMVIDHKGKTLSQTDLFKRDLLVMDVALNKQKTIFVSFAYIIPWISSGIAVLILVLTLIKKIRKKRSRLLS